jgi:hypothetical protein
MADHRFRPADIDARDTRAPFAVGFAPSSRHSLKSFGLLQTRRSSIAIAGMALVLLFVQVFLARIPVREGVHDDH